MPEPDARLGVAFDANKLLYAVSAPASPGILERVGQVDFSFDLSGSLTSRDPDTFPSLKETILKLIRDHGAGKVHLLVPPQLECWSIVPKSVFDREDERQAHLKILLQDTSLQHIATEWHTISNRDFKLLCIRKKRHLDSFSLLTGETVHRKLFSDFQAGEKWIHTRQYHGSFLTLSCTSGVLSVASYLLGKLRAATFLSLDDPADLPYLWLQHASHLTWMTGMHEQVLVYGSQAERTVGELKPYLDDASEILLMDTLDKMGVTSDEQTFPFPLESAFPTVLLSLC